jgi:hypothetical protein
MSPSPTRVNPAEMSLPFDNLVRPRTGLRPSLLACVSRNQRSARARDGGRVVGEDSGSGVSTLDEGALWASTGSTVIPRDSCKPRTAAEFLQASQQASGSEAGLNHASEAGVAHERPKPGEFDKSTDQRRGALSAWRDLRERVGGLFRQAYLVRLRR